MLTIRAISTVALFWLIVFCTAPSGFARELGRIFTAVPPYNPSIGETTQFVDLGGKERHFDFGGAVPIINSTTGVTDFATINVWDPVSSRAVVLTSSQIAPSGVQGRVFKTGGYTAVGYIRGDGIVEGKLRTQINSFPIPSRKRFVWDLSFRLGGSSLNAPWNFTPKGVAPATLWQLKTVGFPPALVMAVDTDPADSSKLMLNFDAKLDPSLPAIRLGEVSRISPFIDINVRIDAFLDERLVSQGGNGYLRIFVNDELVIDRWGPVLQQFASWPYHWSLAMYLYSNITPLDFDRFVYWKRARLISYD
jgi:hypothetical protein